MTKPRAVGAALLAVALALGTAASPATAASKFRSCAELQAKFPNGVAKNKAAAQAIIAAGFEAPRVNAALYKTHFKNLDRDRDGVMCEVPI
jgi:hypothetical protein